MSRSSIRFLHGFERRDLEGHDPNTTVLNWLREEERRTGTKEGCAEGDCGACTVVLARLENGGLRYRAVNACILFLPQLDGAQLITVEHLQDESGKLHPVQQAMVDHHGSQCGFCTPGFVMSLFALGKAGPLGKDGPDAARNEVCDALAGNLCRCTGYRPIVDAALDALAEEGRDRFDAQASETIAALKALDVDQPLTIETGGKRYVAPRTLGHLADLVSKNPDAHLLAGGTDVGLWVTKQHRDLDLVIDVTRVPELKRVDESETDLVIGAAVTYHQAHEALRRRFQDFGELVRRIGGRQVREVGTIGGNIANGSPIGDTMPALIALNAVIVLQKGDRRRTLDLEDFYLDYRRTALEPGEFLAEIRLPNSAVDFRCYKISKRFDQDISAVMAAFALELDQDRRVRTMRIGFGGMAAVPKRAAGAEQAMLGQPWNEATIEAGQAALAAELKPLSDMRASAQYRLSVAENLLAKFFIETTRPKARTRVLDRA